MTARSIVIAPLSNDPLRDWPMAHYRELAELCVANLDATVRFIGTRAQRAPVARSIRTLSAERHINLCGTTSWGQLTDLLRDADCVVANNSGIAHRAAQLGATTVCIFGASHNPYEWMARGRHVNVLIKKTGCAPCAIGRLENCPFGQRCLTEITPAQGLAAVQRAMARRNG